MGIAVAQENSPSPWLPQNLGLRMTQATFPGTQGSKDWNLLGTGHHLQPEVTPHLTSPHDAESQRSSGRNLDMCHFYLFSSKFVVKPSQSCAWNKAIDEPGRAERS